MKFRPETLVHRVIIKPFVTGKKTASGIVLATDERMQAVNSDRGEVFMIGPEAWKAFGCITPPVKVGDHVYYSKYGAKVLKDTDNEDNFYIICNDEDILVSYAERAEK